MKHYMLCTLLSLMLLGGCATSGPKPPGNTRPVEVTMLTTGYCKCKQCCGWKRNWYGKPVVKGTGQRKAIGVTASGTKARPGTLAADTARYPFGTVMHIPGYGYGRVEDRGSAIRGEHIDLFFKSHRQALQWGSRRVSVKVYLPAHQIRAAAR